MGKQLHKNTVAKGINHFSADLSIHARNPIIISNVIRSVFLNIPSDTIIESLRRSKQKIAFARTVSNAVEMSKVTSICQYAAQLRLSSSS